MGCQISFTGLGTRWWIELLDRQTFPEDLANKLINKVKLFDQLYSRFKTDSLIGKLNDEKTIKFPPAELLQMFSFAHKMNRATAGVFDISVGGTLQRLGYGDTSSGSSNLPTFFRDTIYNQARISIPQNAAVDLGGFGKGWLLDVLAVYLEKSGYSQYLINGGGDIVLSSDKPVDLGLEHPYDNQKVISTTQLKRGSLAVSSTVKRRWDKQGKTSHHIIDPSLDDSADTEVISTYVKAETALIADVLATVLLIRPDLKEKLCQRFAAKAIVLMQSQLTDNHQPNASL